MIDIAIIAQKIYRIEHPERVALSRRFPLFLPLIIWTRRLVRYWQNRLDPAVSWTRSKDYFTHIVARHQSVLRRRLGDSDPILQEQKIINLERAVQDLDGVIIGPGEIFSLWQIIGQPTRARGYVNGMLLSQGVVVEGLGGGLCQLANFLCWLWLHAPVEIVERYHHSYDVFPDSGRVLPFGSGATILYNFIDLKIKNVGQHPLQLKIWLTDTHLKGQIVSPHIIPEKYHVFEKDHAVYVKGGHYYRGNEIWREQKIAGNATREEKLFTNLAPILYDSEHLMNKGFTIIDLDNAESKN